MSFIHESNTDLLIESVDTDEFYSLALGLHMLAMSDRLPPELDGCETAIAQLIDAVEDEAIDLDALDGDDDEDEDGEGDWTELASGPDVGECADCSGPQEIHIILHLTNDAATSADHE